MLRTRVDQQALDLLLYYCDKNQYLSCEKKNESGVKWNQRYLKVSSDYISYFNQGKLPSDKIKKAQFPKQAVTQFYVENKGDQRNIFISFPPSQVTYFLKGIMQKKEQKKNSSWNFRFKISQTGDPFTSQALLSLPQLLQNPIRDSRAPTLDRREIRRDSKEQNEFFSNQAKKDRMRTKWDYRYNRLWEEYYTEVLKDVKFDSEFEIKFALSLNALIGEFRQNAVNCVKILVEEFVFPMKWRQYKEIKNDHPMFQFKQKNEFAYVVDGIFIRMSYILINRQGSDQNKQGESLLSTKPKIMETSTKSQSFLFDDSKKSKDDKSGAEIYFNLQTKMLQHEYRANNVIADSIHQLILQYNNDYTLRIPLSCQVDYLGFTCLCTPVSPLLLPPISKNKNQEENLGKQNEANCQSLIYGMKKNGDFLEIDNSKLKSDLEKLGQYLRLKPFSVNSVSSTSSTQIEIHLSLFSEIHCLKNQELIANEIKCEVEGETVKAQQKRMRILNSKQKKNDKSDIQENKKFYLMKTATIFPLELDVEAQKPQTCLFRNRLRPEFLCLISSFLSNGAFLNQSSLINTDQDDLQLAAAGLKLKNDNINKLVRDLEVLQIQPIGPEQLSKYFHMYGVNMRHLGKVASRTDLPFIKEICLTDMIARSTKKILRANLTEFILFRQSNNENDIFKADFQKLKDLLEKKPKEESESSFLDEGDENDYYMDLQQMDEENRKWDNEIYDESKQTQNKFEPEAEAIKSRIRTNFSQELKKIFMDYLNLVFSSDLESLIFWSQVLRPQVLNDFGYDITSAQATQIAQGFLLHSISYHWRIEFVQDDYTKIFTTFPFSSDEKMQLKYVTHSKIYQFSSLSAIKLVDEYHQCISAKQYDLAEKYMDIKRQMLKLRQEAKLTAPFPKQENQLIIEMANIVLLKIEALSKENSEKLFKRNQKLEFQLRKSPQQAVRLVSESFNKNSTSSPEQDILAMNKTYNSLEDEVKRQYNSMPSYHAERIKAMTTLIKIYIAQSKITNNEEIIEKKHNDSMDMYQRIQQLVEYHLGSHHPMTVDLYSMLSDYHFSVSIDERGYIYLQEAINKCKAILGGNHIKIAYLYQKQAMIYLKINRSHQALQYLKSSQYVIEAQYGPNSMNYAQVCFDISMIYFLTSRLQNGLDLCDKAYKIFLQKEQKYLIQCLNCCYEGCKAALNLFQPKEVLEYADKTWQILSKYQNDKHMKRAMREQIIEFILKVYLFYLIFYFIDFGKAIITVIIMSMKPNERNFLFSILLFQTSQGKLTSKQSDKKNNKDENEMLESRESIILNKLSPREEEEEQEEQEEYDMLDPSSPKAYSLIHEKQTDISSLDLNSQVLFEDQEIFNFFEVVREKHKQIYPEDDFDQFLRLGLYPDNRIFDPELDLIQKEKKPSKDEKRNKREYLDDLLQKDNEITGIEIVRIMFNELLARRKQIGQKDFFSNYKFYLTRSPEDKLECIETFKSFIDIFGVSFFYKLLQSTQFTNFRILDYDIDDSLQLKM